MSGDLEYKQNRKKGSEFFLLRSVKSLSYFNKRIFQTGLLKISLNKYGSMF